MSSECGGGGGCGGGGSDTGFSYPSWTAEDSKNYAIWIAAGNTVLNDN